MKIFFVCFLFCVLSLLGWAQQPGQRAYLHDHIEAYGGDPNQLYLMGHSAGAHLAALVATDPSRLQAQGKSPDIL